MLVSVCRGIHISDTATARRALAEALTDAGLARE